MNRDCKYRIDSSNKYNYTEEDIFVRKVTDQQLKDSDFKPSKETGKKPSVSSQICTNCGELCIYDGISIFKYIDIDTFRKDFFKNRTPKFSPKYNANKRFAMIFKLKGIDIYNNICTNI